VLSLTLNSPQSIEILASGLGTSQTNVFPSGFSSNTKQGTCNNDENKATATKEDLKSPHCGRSAM